MEWGYYRGIVQCLCYLGVISVFAYYMVLYKMNKTKRKSMCCYKSNSSVEYFI